MLKKKTHSTPSIKSVPSLLKEENHYKHIVPDLWRCWVKILKEGSETEELWILASLRIHWEKTHPLTVFNAQTQVNPVNQSAISNSRKAGFFSSCWCISIYSLTVGDDQYIHAICTAVSTVNCEELDE